MWIKRNRFLWISFALFAILSCQVTSPFQEQGSPNGSSPTSSNSPAVTATGPEFVIAQTPPEAKVNGFFQNTKSPQEVDYCITYTNHDATHAQFDSMFQITAYDSSGNSLGTGGDVVGWIMPGQSLPFYGMMFLNSNGPVARIDVQAQDPGELAAPPGGNPNPLTAVGANEEVIQEQPEVIGSIHNNLKQNLLNVDVTAMAFDANNQLVDVSQGSLPFVRAGQQAAVEVDLHTNALPARIELYPYPNRLAEFVDAEGPALNVEKESALLTSPGQVEATFIVKNNASQSYASTPYIASVVDAQGNPLAVDTGELPLIFPNDRAAYTTQIPISEESQPASLQVQVLALPDSDPANQAVSSVNRNPISINQVQYQPNPVQNGNVTAQVTNISSHFLDSIDLTAELYDSNGQIVGTGTTRATALHAGGHTQVSVPVDVKGDVAKTELFATVDAGELVATPGAGSVTPGGSQDTPAPVASAPQILTQWFEQPKNTPSILNYAFLLENPNASSDLQNLTIQATAYDSTGSVLNSNTDTIGQLPAGQRLGVVETMVIKSETQVARLDLALTDPGQPQAAAGATLLQATQVSYTRYQNSAVVSGLITSTFPQEITGVSINALVFDSTGKIVSAATDPSYTYFVPANGQAPVAVSVPASDQAVKAEVYPVYSPDQVVPPTPPGLQPLRLTATGFIQDSETPANVWVTFIVQNPNSGQGITQANWQVAVYDTGGALLATISSAGSNPLSALYPDSSTCKFAYLQVPAESRVARAQVQLDQGQAVATSGQSPLVADKVTYLTGTPPQVSSLVTNKSTNDLSYVYVDAVLLDAAGNIVGGGSGRIESLAANSQAPVIIDLTTSSEFSGTPASIEVYPHIDTIPGSP